MHDNKSAYWCDKYHEANAQLEAAKHDRDGAVEQYLESQKALRAAKQRELELLAVIEQYESQHNIDSDGWCSTCKTTTDGKCNKPINTQSQALREHDAKVLEDAADCFAGGGWGMTPEDTLRSMAEERRKK